MRSPEFFCFLIFWCFRQTGWLDAAGWHARLPCRTGKFAQKPVSPLSQLKKLGELDGQTPEQSEKILNMWDSCQRLKRNDRAIVAWNDMSIRGNVSRRNRLLILLFPFSI